MKKIRPIAIHLPQFHPIAENDEWWGKGFTEWTNVTKAKPLFNGHYQPHLPADLGFYDLRLEEARLAQEALAKEYGIYGFCYYHYWFNGKRLLNEPIDRKLKNLKEDFPFMLCWANENWTRRWDGQEQEVLIKQEYSSQDDKEHINFLCENFFKDSRYIKVDGKPMLLIYRPNLFPNINTTLNLWRSEALKLGIGELYIGYVQSFGNKVDPNILGFDFGIQFQPDFEQLPEQIYPPFVDKLKNRLGVKPSAFYTNKIYNYDKHVEKQKTLGFQKNIFPGITPMWDNSARRSNNAFILKDSTPEKYAEWLTHIKLNYNWNQMPESFLFINAWNEWAEGNHLEPCLKWETQYLQKTREILKHV